eukprot:1962002-Ditylum_brightwellii.AAC.2
MGIFSNPLQTQNEKEYPHRKKGGDGQENLLATIKCYIQEKMKSHNVIGSSLTKCWMAGSHHPQ